MEQELSFLKGRFLVTRRSCEISQPLHLLPCWLLALIDGLLLRLLINESVSCLAVWWVVWVVATCPECLLSILVAFLLLLFFFLFCFFLLFFLFVVPAEAALSSWLTNLSAKTSQTSSAASSAAAPCSNWTTSLCFLPVHCSLSHWLTCAVTRRASVRRQGGGDYIARVHSNTLALMTICGARCCITVQRFYSYSISVAFLYTLPGWMAVEM